MSTEYAGVERRQHKRLKVNFLVIYAVNKPAELIMIVGNKIKTALMSDLSKTGMSILTGFNIPKGTVLMIKFTLINTSVDKDKRIRSMELNGEVRNNSLKEKNVYRLGILFTHISQQDREAIAEFVEK